jgi:pre-mRNA-splicing helicase BRR2
MSGKKDLSQFNYGAISSLVVNQGTYFAHYLSALTSPDRSVIRSDEPTGKAETLKGRINVAEMGSRMERDAPKDLEKKKAKATAKLSQADAIERSIRRAQETSTARFGAADVLASVAEHNRDERGVRADSRLGPPRARRSDFRGRALRDRHGA